MGNNGGFDPLISYISHKIDSINRLLKYFYGIDILMKEQK